ncbi:uncharacterized protein K441DRAFT_690675 [Cenococcum geophilum 1.58]|uniref:Uncharacterized protein n=1 Tax=Cenococcum geophilum 1.58 TaxID=794803 RepID=A0ACC8EQ88_9PEZI|nr:hypothetical protein K441DRAFT_690675 [Cenococcum geophilum 1.58]
MPKRILNSHGENVQSPIYLSHMRFLRSKKGSQLAVLPEYHLTSCVPEHPDFIASYAESVACLPVTKPAQDLNIHIVPGTIVELSNRYQASNPLVTELRNVAYFIAAPAGDILSTCQKKNLWYLGITKISPKVLALNLKSEVAFLDSVTVARAYENTHVAMPIMGCLGKLGVEKGDMITSEVDLDMLRVAEEHYKVRADL